MTIAVIPARGGSKRLVNKNCLPLGNMPLLVHSILYAKANSNCIDAVYVSTDDSEIKKIATEYGAIVIDRPSAISGDLEPTITAVQHVLQSINHKVENVVLLQATNPLRPDALLSDCFEIFSEFNCESLFTVSRNHHKLGTIKNNIFVPSNYKIGQRSQDLKPLYYENGLIYIAKSEAIMKGNLISEKSFPYRLNHIFATVDIDTQEDLDYANYLYQKNITTL